MSVRKKAATPIPPPDAVSETSRACTSSDPSTWTCPVPLSDYPTVVLGHGGGGKLSHELVEHLFLPAFDNPRNPSLGGLADSALLSVGDERLAFSTDSFVVRPLFFPGGSIGDLAVNGTVNDLAMSGAIPLCLSAGFIIEEGFSIQQLGEVTRQMAAAAERAGVSVVTGDTKVVERGLGDGLYINTAGIGRVARDTRIGPERAEEGDVVLVSGTVGDHGMAIMSVRESLEFEAAITSDTAPLHELVQAMLVASPNGVHVMRDPTRGGLASSLNEIAAASGVGMLLEEQRIPVSVPVRSACEILGLDPLLVANEGKLVAVVSASSSDRILQAMRAHPLGRDAVAIGHVMSDPSNLVVAKTAIGATRVITTAVGEQLPRIC